MFNNEHVYIPPRVTQLHEDIPVKLKYYLDGEDLLSKKQALRISTVNADGWPHAALLSAGDVLLLSNNCIRFVIFPDSSTTANMQRDPRIAISMSFDGKMIELRMHAHQYRESTDEVPLAFFEAKIDEIRIHESNYATITSGVDFALNKPEITEKRWKKQINTLKE